jgi:hypothetical protein
LLTPWGELLVSSGITCQVIKKPYREEFSIISNEINKMAPHLPDAKEKSFHPVKYTPN